MSIEAPKPALELHRVELAPAEGQEEVFGKAIEGMLTLDRTDMVFTTAFSPESQNADVTSLPRESAAPTHAVVIMPYKLNRTDYPSHGMWSATVRDLANPDQPLLKATLSTVGNGLSVEMRREITQEDVNLFGSVLGLVAEADFPEQARQQQEHATRTAHATSIGRWFGGRRNARHPSGSITE